MITGRYRVYPLLALFALFGWSVGVAQNPAPEKSLAITLSVSPVDSTAGQPLSLPVRLAGVEGAEFSADGLPPGVTISPATGLIEGTPTKAGKYTPTVSVRVPLSFTMTVLDAAHPAPPPGPDQYVAAHDSFPNYAKTPDTWNVRDGKASDPTTWNKPLADNAVVLVRGNVTWDIAAGEGSPPLKALGVTGTLTLATGSHLRATTLIVAPEGALLSSGGSIVSFPDRPIDYNYDPSAYGHGMIVMGKCHLKGPTKTHNPRVAKDHPAGSTTLTFKAPVEGWQCGDRLATCAWYTVSERLTVKSVAPDRKSVELETPTTFNIRGTFPEPDGSGQKFLPEVLNLTRSIVVRSENARGVRGHCLFTGRADVDLVGVQFQSLGRTTVDHVHNTTFNPDGSVKTLGKNQQGRYSVHLHHLDGPENAAAQGRPQFRVEGCSIWCGLPDHTFRWAVTLHGASYGIVKNNAIYNWYGWGIGTESGSEVYNVIEGNAISHIKGVAAREHLGRDGQGIWVNTPINTIRANTVSGCPNGDGGPGFTIGVFGRGEAKIPEGPGKPPTKDIDLYAQTIVEFARNEAYSCSVGYSVWNLGGRAPGGAGVIKDCSAWHVSTRGVFMYPSNKLVWDGFTFRGDRDAKLWAQQGFYFGDYGQTNLTIRNADLLWVDIGVYYPINSFGEWTLENSTIGASKGVVWGQPWTVGDPRDIGPQSGVIRNVKFITDKNVVPLKWNSPPNQAIRAGWSASGLKFNHVVSNRLFVEDFNGTPGDSFRVYFTQQKADFVVPQSAGGTFAAPEPGLTNAQLWAKYGLAIAGEVAPADAAARPLVVGLVK